jgi:hypothetical protein
MPGQPDAYAVLLGGIGGAVIAFILQTVRDGLAARRRVRSAANVIRMEVVENGAIVQNVVAGHRPSTVGVAQLRRSAFDSLLPDVVAYANERELLQLATYGGGIAPIHEIVLDKARGPLLTRVRSRHS